jgi:hypothetical protein
MNVARRRLYEDGPTTLDEVLEARNGLYVPAEQRQLVRRELTGETSPAATAVDQSKSGCTATLDGYASVYGHMYTVGGWPTPRLA